MAQEVIHKGKVNCGNCRGHGQQTRRALDGLPVKDYVTQKWVIDPCPICLGKGHFGTVDEYLQYVESARKAFDNCPDFGIM